MGGENLPTTTQENDVNIDIPQRRGMSGSYLFRSKKESTDGDREKKSNRRGGYLFRTKKMGRYTRGMYFFIYLILIKGHLKIWTKHSTLISQNPKQFEIT